MVNAIVYTVLFTDGSQVSATAEEIAAARKTGELRDDTPLWREGLEAWSTVDDLREELGMPEHPTRGLPRRKAIHRTALPPIPVVINIANPDSLKNAPSGSYICKACGSVGRPIRIPRIVPNWERVASIAAALLGAGAHPRDTDLACASCASVEVAAARSPKGIHLARSRGLKLSLYPMFAPTALQRIVQLVLSMAGVVLFGIAIRGAHISSLLDTVLTGGFGIVLVIAGFIVRDIP